MNRLNHELFLIDEIGPFAGKLGLPQEDFDFQYDTFRIIAVARAYYFLPHPERTLRLLQKMKNTTKPNGRSRVIRSRSTSSHFLSRALTCKKSSTF